MRKISEFLSEEMGAMFQRAYKAQLSESIREGIRKAKLNKTQKK